MEPLTPSTSTIIPTVNLSCFTDGGDESERKKVIETVYEACTKYGVFLVENHGVSLEQCEKLLKLNRQFFGFPDNIKQHNFWEISGMGYGKYVDDEYHDFEYLFMHGPDRYFNGVPAIQPGYWNAFEEVYKYFVKTSQIVEEIVNDGLGLPPNVLKNNNKDRCWDFMMPMHYTPSDENGNVGIIEHLDPSLFSLILQDDICGLEFHHESEWIQILPQKGTLIVIMGDLIQVLSNKIIRNLPHRAFKNKDGKRLAIDFCYNYGPENYVEPLHALTTDIGVEPKYYGFVNKEYTDLIANDYLNPPATADGFTKISHFEKK